MHVFPSHHVFPGCLSVLKAPHLLADAFLFFLCYFGFVYVDVIIVVATIVVVVLWLLLL